MSSETPTATASVEETAHWKGGAVAGLAAGVAMGILLTVMMRPVIAVAIPALYGVSGLAAGWAAHLFHSAVLGVVFAGVAGASGYADTHVKSAALGVAYGGVLWVVLAALVMPVWLGAVGFPNVPPLPNFNPQSLVGHLVYGAILGAVYPSVRSL